MPCITGGVHGAEELLRTRPRSSENAAPGVTVSTLRAERPLRHLGVLYLLAIATRKRRKYSLTALTGTPASGTSAAPPLFRAVSVRPR